MHVAERCETKNDIRCIHMSTWTGHGDILYKFHVKYEGFNGISTVIECFIQFLVVFIDVVWRFILGLFILR